MACAANVDVVDQVVDHKRGGTVSLSEIRGGHEHLAYQDHDSHFEFEERTRDGVRENSTETIDASPIVGHSPISG